MKRRHKPKAKSQEPRARRVSFTLTAKQHNADCFCTGQLLRSPTSDGVTRVFTHDGATIAELKEVARLCGMKFEQER